MKDELLQEVTALDSLPDSSMYDYRVSMEKLKEQLAAFGLTANQCKVYIYLGKYGSKTAPEVCRALKLPRTETYHLLTTLQNKGIVSATFQHPIRFSALPLNKAVWVLVNAEKERVRNLEVQEKNIMELWNLIPDFQTELVEAEKGKFQMLEGSNQINGKIKEMIGNATQEFTVLGSEKDFLKFYHSDFLSQLENSEVELKLLTSSSDRTMYIFDEVDRNNVKRMPPGIPENLCFIIKDETDLLLFIENANQSDQQMMAMWTNSSAMINSTKLLFSYIWQKAKFIPL